MGVFQRFLKLADAEDAIVLQRTLHYINELVVASGIARLEEKSGVDQIVNGVMHDSFHDFSVEKQEPDPYSMNDGRAGMELQRLVMLVSLKAVYIEDGLCVFGRDILYSA
jgi:hypothetical protein